MQRSIKEILDERREMLTKTADTIGGKLEKYPAGRIAIKRHGDRIYYYSYGETGEKLLKKEDRKLLEDLLQKSYLEKVVRASQSERHLITCPCPIYLFASALIMTFMFSISP